MCVHVCARANAWLSTINHQGVEVIEPTSSNEVLYLTFHLSNDDFNKRPPSYCELSFLHAYESAVRGKRTFIILKRCFVSVDIVSWRNSMINSLQIPKGYRALVNIQLFKCSRYSKSYPSTKTNTLIGASIAANDFPEAIQNIWFDSKIKLPSKRPSLVSAWYAWGENGF